VNTRARDFAHGNVLAHRGSVTLARALGASPVNRYDHWYITFEAEFVAPRGGWPQNCSALGLADRFLADFKSRNLKEPSIPFELGNEYDHGNFERTWGLTGKADCIAFTFCDYGASSLSAATAAAVKRGEGHVLLVNLHAWRKLWERQACQDAPPLHVLKVWEQLTTWRSIENLAGLTELPEDAIASALQWLSGRGLLDEEQHDHTKRYALKNGSWQVRPVRNRKYGYNTWNAYTSIQELIDADCAVKLDRALEPVDWVEVDARIILASGIKCRASNGGEFFWEANAWTPKVFRIFVDRLLLPPDNKDSEEPMTIVGTELAAAPVRRVVLFTTLRTSTHMQVASEEAQFLRAALPFLAELNDYLHDGPQGLVPNDAQALYDSLSPTFRAKLTVDGVKKALTELIVSGYALPRGGAWLEPLNHQTYQANLPEWGRCYWPLPIDRPVD